MSLNYTDLFPLRSKVPLILQHERSECGLACVAMVARYHGVDETLRSLRQRFPSSLRGSTLRDLVYTAEQIGLSCRPLMVSLERLRDVKLPAILHLDFSHFVVLVKHASNRWLVHDPAVGERWLQQDELSRSFTGAALEVVRGERAADEHERPRHKLARVLPRIARVDRKVILQVLWLSLAVQLLLLLVPIFVQFAVDRSLIASDQTLILALGVGLALTLSAQTLLEYARRWALVVMSSGIAFQLGSLLFRRFLALPLGYFWSRSLGDLSSRFSSLRIVTGDIYYKAALICADSLVSVVVLLVMFAYDVRLACVSLAAVIGFGVFRIALSARIRRAAMQEIAAEARKENFVLEALRGAETIKLFQAETQQRHMFESHQAAAISRRGAVERANTVGEIAEGFIFALELVAIIVMGVLAVIRGSLSVGALYALLLLRTQLVDRMRGIFALAAALVELRVHIERIVDVLEHEPDRIPSRHAGPMEPGRLEIDALAYRHTGSRKYLFRDLSLIVEPGQWLGIKGSSGCGKTTLVRVLSGLLAPDSGQVRVVVGDTAVRDVDVRSVASAVTQDQELYFGTIRDNIGLFQYPIDDARVRDAALRACLADDIAAMPMGYDTLIADRGSGLSAGQRQRLCLARALYRPCSILFLDEATSHVDPQTEREIFARLAVDGPTVVLIAHRAETLEWADVVLDLQDRVVTPQHGDRLALGNP